MPPYVWMMYGCPQYIHNTKKACSVRLRGCPYAPINLNAPVHKQHKASMLCQIKGVSICPHTFGCSHMLGCTCCKFGCPHMFGHPICLDAHLYVWTPPMFGCPCMFGWATCLNTPCMFGCFPYVWLSPVCLDAPKCMGASKGMREIQTYG